MTKTTKLTKTAKVSAKPEKVQAALPELDNWQVLDALVAFQEELAELDDHQLLDWCRMCQRVVTLPVAAKHLDVSVAALKALSKAGKVPIKLTEDGKPVISNAWLVMQQWYISESLESQIDLDNYLLRRGLVVLRDVKPKVKKPAA